MADRRPIGVFDSGVGGLTVLREILRRTPAEPTVYLGDNARAPYGVRPDEEVLAFSRQSLDELASRDVKAIVVACNTSTAVALGSLRRRYDLPILGVIRPGAAAAALASRNKRVGVGSSRRPPPSVHMPISTQSRTRTRRSKCTNTPRRCWCHSSKMAS
jgi:glutamate racemase